MGDEATEEEAEEGERGEGEEGDPEVSGLGCGASAEAPEGREDDGEDGDGEEDGDEVLGEVGPVVVADEEFAVALGDGAGADGGDVVVLPLGSERGFEREDEENAGAACGDGGEHGTVEVATFDGAG